MNYLKVLQKKQSLFLAVFVLILFCVSICASEASLTITRYSDDSGSAQPGDILTYSIDYSVGSVDEHDVVISSDPVPDERYYIPDSATWVTGSSTVQYIDADDPSGQYSFTNNQPVWAFSTLPAGSAGTLSFKVKVPVSYAGGDNTSNLQAAINSTASAGQVLYIPAGNYSVIQNIATVIGWNDGNGVTYGGLTIPSNAKLLLAQGANIQAGTGYTKHGSVINIANTANIVSNVVIEGYGATITMQKSEYVTQDPDEDTGITTDQWRHGVYIRGASNIKIFGLASNDSGGDGFIVAGLNNQNYSDAVTLLDCSANNNLRNGLSIISANNLLVKRCSFANSNGHAPQAGIDIEPDNSTQRLVNIKVEDSTSSGNVAYGVNVTLLKMNSTSNPVSVYITRHTDTNGGNPYLDPYGPFLPGNTHPATIQGSRTYHSYNGFSNGLSVEGVQGVGGTVRFDNCTSTNSDGYGAGVESWKYWDATNHGALIAFLNLTITNPAQNVTQNPIYAAIDKSPIHIGLHSNDAQELGNIHFYNTTIVAQSSKVDYYFTVDDAVNNQEKGMSNLVLSHNYFSGAVNHPYGLLKGVPVTLINIQ